MDEKLHNSLLVVCLRAGGFDPLRLCFPICEMGVEMAGAHGAVRLSAGSRAV